ncbi:hypothetical protein TNCV_4520571 [Trichonephila clavipes]|nr:hypothetical protein TNCV_4520571 [Trichonephila clavipes]
MAEAEKKALLIKQKAGVPNYPIHYTVECEQGEVLSSCCNAFRGPYGTAGGLQTKLLMTLSLVKNAQPCNAGPNLSVIKQTDRLLNTNKLFRLARYWKTDFHSQQVLAICDSRSKAELLCDSQNSTLINSRVQMFDRSL